MWLSCESQLSSFLGETSKMKRFLTTTNEPECKKRQKLAAPCLLHKSIIPQSLRVSAFDALVDRDVFAPQTGSLYGKPFVSDRKVASFGKKGLVYSYAGSSQECLSWDDFPELLKILKVVEEKTGEKFNYCLANLYTGGTVGLGWHSDKTTGLSPGSSIVSVSLGSTRRFSFKPVSGDSKVINHSLESGDVVVMTTESQKHWKHTVRTTKKLCGPRINLTFRSVTQKANSETL